MQVFCKDFTFGDSFRASDYGLTCIASFDDKSEATDSYEMTPTFQAEFLGENSHNTYLAQKYSDTLTLEFSMIKDPCVYINGDDALEEYDVRSILRLLTGKRGYQWLRIVPEQDDTKTDIWYKCYCSKVERAVIGGRIVGLLPQFTLDGAQAYSDEQNVRMEITAGTRFALINNSDDLWAYEYPTFSITVHSDGDLVITNESEDDWNTEIKDCKEGEIITMDSKNELLSSSVVHSNILNDFNLHWLRLVAGSTKYVSNLDLTLEYSIRTKRKVGIL